MGYGTQSANTECERENFSINFIIFSAIFLIFHAFFDFFCDFYLKKVNFHVNFPQKFDFLRLFLIIFFRMPPRKIKKDPAVVAMADTLETRGKLEDLQ